jgi:hypothetical protein
VRRVAVMTRKEIHERAVQRMQDEAQDRYIRIEQKRIAKLEQAMLDRMHAENRRVPAVGARMSARELTITKLERAPEGYWRARVTGSDGVTVDVDRRWGSWQAEVRAASRVQRFVRKDVEPWAAERLQDRVRPLERRERAAAVESYAAWQRLEEITRRLHEAKPDDAARLNEWQSVLSKQPPAPQAARRTARAAA